MMGTEKNIKTILNPSGKLAGTLGQESTFPAGRVSFRSFADYLGNFQNDALSGTKTLREGMKQIYAALEKNAQDAEGKSAKQVSFFEQADKIVSFNFIENETRFHLYMHPVSGEILYISDNLKTLYGDEAGKEVFARTIEDYFNGTDGIQLNAYKAIWQKFHNQYWPFLGENIVGVNFKDGMGTKYYKLEISYKFVDIINGVPEVSKIINECDTIAINSEDLIKNLRIKLPLEQFTFSGFKLLTVSDVTAQHIKDIISRQIVLAENQQESIACQKEVIQTLEIVTECCDLEFGLYPMLKVNDRYVFNDPRKGESFFTKTVSNEKQRQNLYDYLETTFRKLPQKIFFDEIPEEKAIQYDYLRLLKDRQVSGFLLMPVFYQGDLVGVLEVFSRKPGLLTNAIISRLENYFPVLGVLFKKSIDRFDLVLDEIIRDKFTSLQPSVQWKFNNVAWKFLEQNRLAFDEIEEIGFDGVYPLYGAIDIKNSTVNRNAALSEDFIYQFTLLCEVIEKIKKLTGIKLAEEKIFLCRLWMERARTDEAAVQGGELNYFLQNDIHVFLNDLSSGNTQIKDIVKPYFDALDDESGLATSRRRMLEKSMTHTIKMINEEVEALHCQSIRDYPCFFEKFRTDGVEYDIYIGQSMAPWIPFNELYIQNLRLLQLTSMISIAQKVVSMQNDLPVPIEITQLIFVHPYNIDIRFRRDERRFDVEGAYNIRYHILKKRIDKVLIKNTSERLTAPGKIAIVYFNQKDADEFLIHIKFLNGQGLLSEEIEFLELEELQGVSGLKSLRVSIGPKLPTV